MKNKILIGYEVGTGDPVYIPEHHLVATGLTRLSGKTTTLEALITRSGLRAVVFRTKRGEAAFNEGHQHKPFFKERADWQYVQSIMESVMREKMRFERSWIIKVSKGAKTLNDVRNNVVKELETARGINEGVYTNLKAYLDIVIPALDQVDFATRLELRPGVNVMDLEGLPEEVQLLVMASTVDHVREHMEGVILVIAEAWKVCPEGRSTPAKLPVEKTIREGGALRIWVWFDSQDITGVDKTPLKSVEVWALGRQRELNEIKRTLDQLPISKKDRPKPEDIARLGLGQFYVCAGTPVKLTYVQPAWMPGESAQAIARGTMTIDEALEGRHNKPRPRVDHAVLEQEEEDLTKEEVERLTREKKQLLEEKRELLTRVEKLERRIEDLSKAKAPPLETGRKAGDHQIGGGGGRATLVDPGSASIEVKGTVEERPDVILEQDLPTLTVQISRPKIHLDQDSDDSRLGELIVDGYFDEARTVVDICKEFQTRGWGNWMNGGGGPGKKMRGIVEQFAAYGFFKLENKWVKLREGVKNRVIVKEVEA